MNAASQHPTSRGASNVAVRPSGRASDAVPAFLSRLRSRDVAVRLRVACLGSTPASAVELGPRPMPVVVIDDAGHLLGVAGPQQIRSAGQRGLLAVDAATPLERLLVAQGEDPAISLADALRRDGFALVQAGERVLAAEMEDVERQARIFSVLSRDARSCTQTGRGR